MFSLQKAFSVISIVFLFCLANMHIYVHVTNQRKRDRNSLDSIMSNAIIDFVRFTRKKIHCVTASNVSEVYFKHQTTTVEFTLTIL